jgi:4-hydroxybenzoate polyprenyltransferase
LASLVLAGTIVLYDVYHKQNPLSPLLMGLCRVLVYVTVAFAARGVLPGAVVLGALALWCHLIGLTYAAKQENLARLRSVWPLAVLGLAPAYGLRLAFQEPRAAAFLALFAGWLVYSLRFLLSSRQRSIPGAVVRLIAGVALLDAVLIAATGAMELAVVAVAFCGVTRLLQRVVPGT